MSERTVPSFFSDGRPRPAVSFSPEIGYWAIRGKLPPPIRRQHEIEIERAVSRAGAPDINVSQWIEMKSLNPAEREREVVQSMIWGSGLRSPIRSRSSAGK